MLTNVHKRNKFIYANLITVVNPALQIISGVGFLFAIKNRKKVDMKEYICKVI